MDSKKKFWQRRKFWRRFIIITVLVPVVAFAAIVGIVYWKQDAIVGYLLEEFNEDFTGELEIKDSHISPFANFPHITLDLEDVKVWEGKDKHDISPIIELEDVYIGFNLFTLIGGDFDINFARLENGRLDLILHEDGSFNVTNALSGGEVEDTDAAAEEFHLHLKSIQLKDLDIHKYDERNQVDIEAYVYEADAAFKTSPNHIMTELKSKLLVNVINGGDTTVVKHKHLEIDTRLDFLEETAMLVVDTSDLVLEHGEFTVDGSIDFNDSLNVDINVHGKNKNFDLLIAFAPEELIPTLERYENAGEIYFEANVSGKSNGKLPAFEVDFGCDKAYFRNTTNDRSMDKLHFDGHFHNKLNEKHDVSAMQFTLANFSANPGLGSVKADVDVKNFDSPEIDMKINSDFNLDYLQKFLNLKTLDNLDGQVVLKMNFHDIIDPTRPEKAIEKLNEAYFAELKIKDLTFTSTAFGLPVDKINMQATMDGHEADIDYIDIKVGRSDIHVDGKITDLPAILHHTDQEVDTRLNIRSNFIDIHQMTEAMANGDTTAKPVDEEIENLSLKLDFKASARSFTESKFVPEGEFFIDDLFAKLKHYPHTFHDFHADIFVDENDLRIVDFSGEIDSSDFHFIGKLHDYGFWFADELEGDTRIEFDFLADHLRLEDLFAYQGENYVPEDYRHEELKELKLHGLTDLHFKDGLESADLRLSRLDAKMKIHPLKLQKFKGRIHYEDDHIQIDTLYGQIGKSSFTMDLNYYLGEDENVRKRDNHLGLHARKLDLDELMNYNPPPVSASTPPAPVDHEDVFNIYDLPFSPMTFDVDVADLNYHKYRIQNFVTKFRTERDHFIRLDTMQLNAAGGRIAMNGVFDGRNRDKIFLDPIINLTGVDLDQLLFKFDNFGQDYLVSENLHGQLSGTITGHLHIHPDFVPKLDDSELHLDIEVLDGKLENYEPIMAMSDYFGDKNLSSVRFDSLINALDVENGVLKIPNMTINTTLGHMDFSGEQSMDGDYDMEYYVRVPWKMVSGVAKSKLFGKKDETEEEAMVDAGDAMDEEEIIYKDDSKKRVRYLNLKITGNADDYKVGMGKDKREKKERRRKRREKRRG